MCFFQGTGEVTANYPADSNGNNTAEGKAPARSAGPGSTLSDPGLFSLVNLPRIGGNGNAIGAMKTSDSAAPPSTLLNMLFGGGAGGGTLSQWNGSGGLFSQAGESSMASSSSGTNNGTNPLTKGGHH